jgi:hypothetical protein
MQHRFDRGRSRDRLTRTAGSGRCGGTRTTGDAARASGHTARTASRTPERTQLPASSGAAPAHAEGVSEYVRCEEAMPAKPQARSTFARCSRRYKGAKHAPSKHTQHTPTGTRASAVFVQNSQHCKIRRRCYSGRAIAGVHSCGISQSCKIQPRYSNHCVWHGATFRLSSEYSLAWSCTLRTKLPIRQMYLHHARNIARACTRCGTTQITIEHARLCLRCVESRRAGSAHADAKSVSPGASAHTGEG